MNKKEWEPEVLVGKVIKLVDCSITLRVLDYYLTIPMYRVLRIKHKMFGSQYSVSDCLEGVDVELFLVPEKETKWGEKW